MDTLKYFVKVHPLVVKEDLPCLSLMLQQDYKSSFLALLRIDPYGLCGERNGHVLKRPPLVGFRTIDLILDEVDYRLVYRITEATKRVEVFSFDYHKPAYHKAEERVRNNTGYQEN